MLTKAQIRRLLAELAWETVYLDEDRLRLQRRSMGYSEDDETAGLQAKLSIMLEAVKE